jgi:cytoskeletal protein CcmA (bactofilin family)
MSRTPDPTRSPDGPAPDAPGRLDPDRGQLGAGLSVEGTIRGRGDLRVEGALRGSVDLDGTFGVGPQAQITGSLRARRIEIQGEVLGPIEGGHVVVRAGGWVSGDVRAGTIAIDDGATLEGLIEMELDAEPRGRGDAPRRTR